MNAISLDHVVHRSGAGLPLPVMMADLAARRPAIEAAFLDVGDRLTKCMTLLNRHTALFEALPRDFESAELAEATTALHSLGAETGAMAASFAAERMAMGELVAALAGADAPISNLVRAVKMIGIMAVNARVMAASIDDMEDVEVFTGDIARLSSEADATVRAFSNTYRRLVDHVRRTEARRGEFEQNHRRRLLDLSSGLETRLGQLAERRREASAAGSRTGEMTRQIAGRVGAVVLSLQVGDNTRQRLEHVEAALGLLDDLTHGRRGPAVAGIDWSEAAGSPALVAVVTRLQSAQLAGAADHLEEEVKAGEAALRSLQSDVTEMVRQSRLVATGSVKGAEAPLAALNAELRDAGAMLRVCETERGKLDAMAAEAGEVVRSLLSRIADIRAIESSMRLLSLNATMKCARLGSKGRALNVITQQLRELTAETVVSAESTAYSLQRVSEAARRVTAAASADSAGRVGRLEEEAQRALRLVESVDGRLASAVGVLADEAPELLRLLGGAAAAYATQRRVARTLDSAAAQLNGFAGTRPSLTDDEYAEAVFAHLRKTYTMQGERQIHDRLVAEALEN